MERDEKFEVPAVIVVPPSQPKDVWGWKMSPASSGPLLQATWSSSPERGCLWLCPMGCLEPSEKGAADDKVTVLWGRPSQLGSSETSGFLPRPPQAHNQSLPSHSSSSSHPGRWHLFPVTHFLSLWVEGGERGCAGSRVGGCGGGGRGKSLTLHFPPPQPLLRHFSGSSSSPRKMWERPH